MNKQKSKPSILFPAIVAAIGLGLFCFKQLVNDPQKSSTTMRQVTTIEQQRMFEDWREGWAGPIATDAPWSDPEAKRIKLACRFAVKFSSRMTQADLLRNAGYELSEFNLAEVDPEEMTPEKEQVAEALAQAIIPMKAFGWHRPVEEEVLAHYSNERYYLSRERAWTFPELASEIYGMVIIARLEDAGPAPIAQVTDGEFVGMQIGVLKLRRDAAERWILSCADALASDDPTGRATAAQWHRELHELNTRIAQKLGLYRAARARLDGQGPP